ncbi:MAG: hypothetical protein KGS45_05290 [Planctomycetes bacterium]|nr:hypothetical protein [Planctomycetota bacterium]
MADRHVQLDKEAIARLESDRAPGESLSDTVKRVVKPSFDVDAWLRKLKENPASPAMIRALEEQVNGRLKCSRKRR